MLFSFALIIVVGYISSALFGKLKLPGLLGMILTGILLGPYSLNLMDAKVLNISADLREIALIVILLRAGLSLDIRDLKKVGRPAVLMCFVPASLEIAAITWLAPLFFGISTLEAAILGTVIAAVSPAVVVPRMMGLLEKGYGAVKQVPQLVMAGASVDDVYVIVLFTAFLAMYSGKSFNPVSLVKIPLAIGLGLLIGFVIGYLMVRIFKKFRIRDTVKVMILLSVAFSLVSLEATLKSVLPMSGLLAVMALGLTMAEFYKPLAERLLARFSKIWVAAEIFLFVLVGAQVQISYIGGIGLLAIGLVGLALVARTIGVSLCLVKTRLNRGERLYCAFSYLPKATVQAAIGSIPLAAGVASGRLILSIAVLAILITAPLGAVLMDKTYHKLLIGDKRAQE